MKKALPNPSTLEYYLQLAVTFQGEHFELPEWAQLVSTNNSYREVFETVLKMDQEQKSKINLISYLL